MVYALYYFIYSKAFYISRVLLETHLNFSRNILGDIL